MTASSSCSCCTSSLGLLAMLPFVPERAGAQLLQVLLRRRGVHDHGRRSACSTAATAWRRAAPGPAAPTLRAAARGHAGVRSSLTVLYNRALHFGWRGAARARCWRARWSRGGRRRCLGAPGARGRSSRSTDLSSILLLGAAAAAMILGHYYLVVLDLPIGALRRLTVLLIVVARAARRSWSACALAGPVHAGLRGARGLVAAGLWSPDGVFVWMRLLFGLAGPLSLIWFIWKTVEIRSTQSATGILYVQLFLVLSGELLAKYLRVAAGLAAVRAALARDRVPLARRAGARRSPASTARAAARPAAREPTLAVPASLPATVIVDRCPACDGAQLYVQRDFNQKVGLAIVVVGGAARAVHALLLEPVRGRARSTPALYAVLPEITDLLPLPRALPRLRAEPAARGVRPAHRRAVRGEGPARAVRSTWAAA